MSSLANTVTPVIPIGVDSTAILGGANKVRNPLLNIDTNGWSTSGTMATSVQQGKTVLTGDGNFFQTLNTSDVVNGTTYMFRVFVTGSVTGTFTAMIGTSAGDSTAGTMSLATGWNSFRFTAGAANVITFTGTSSSDSVGLSLIEVRQQVDLVVSGQIRNLDMEFGDVLFGNGTAAAPSITFQSDTDTGLYRVSANNLGITAAGSLVGTWSSTGLALNSLSLSGVTTLGLTGAISGATATDTINGVIINAGAVSGVTTLTTSGAISVNDTTDSTSTLTGSIQTDGGGGFAKNVVVGGDLYTTAWTDYSGSSTVTGWSSTTTKIIRYKKIGNLVFVDYDIRGTSNTTGASFTINDISDNTSIAFGGAQRFAQDNGVTLTTASRNELTANSTTVNIFSNMSNGTWTASGTKMCIGQFFYEAQ